VDSVETTEIRPVTGLRCLAALAVVAGQTWLAHRGFLREHFPNHSDGWALVLGQHHVAAGVFLCLSGLVLSNGYLDRLAPGLAQRGSEVARFLLARICRIWPAYLVALHLMLAALVSSTVLGGRQLQPPFDTLGYLRQVLLVHVWTETDHVRTSWLPVGWVLSALVAATVLFPLLAVLVERIARVTEPGTRLAMACLLQVPVMIVLTAAPRSTDGYLWALLVFCYFPAGLLAWTAAVALAPRRAGRWALVLSAATVLLLAFSAWVSIGTNVPARGLVALAVVPVVAAAACSTGAPARLLGSRLLVAGGRVSYTLIMVYAPVIALHAALMPDDLLRDRPVLVLVTIGLTVIFSLATAIGLRRWIEVPVRRMVGTTDEPPRVTVPVGTGNA
jgi:peptidoglycan/LPS O-acetylase OafA/YrhL